MEDQIQLSNMLSKITNPSQPLHLVSVLPDHAPPVFSNPFIQGVAADGTSEGAAGSAVVTAHRDDDKWKAERENRIKNMKNYYLKQCKEKDRTCTFEPLFTSFTRGAEAVGAKLCDKANESKNVMNLIVGYRGLSNTERLALGSVSNHTVHHCNCTVTVVKKAHLNINK